jgi:hypothetical protein
MVCQSPWTVTVIFMSKMECTSCIMHLHTSSELLHYVWSHCIFLYQLRYFILEGICILRIICWSFYCILLLTKYINKLTEVLENWDHLLFYIFFFFFFLHGHIEETNKVNNVSIQVSFHMVALLTSSVFLFTKPT